MDSDRVYVGSAVNIDQRWYAHRSKLKHAKHYNVYLQAAWTKYGAEAFAFEVLEVVELATDLVAREQHWIDTLKPFGKHGFNMSPRAYSILGLKRSEETKAKHRKAWETRVVSAETCAKISAAAKGRRLTDEHRAKIGAASKGRLVSDDARSRIGAAAALRRYGPIPDDRRERMSVSLRGEGNAAAKLTEADVREIRRRLADGERGSDIARAMGIPKLMVSKIKCGRTWTHVQPEQPNA